MVQFHYPKEITYLLRSFWKEILKSLHKTIYDHIQEYLLPYIHMPPIKTPRSCENTGSHICKPMLSTACSLQQ